MARGGAPRRRGGPAAARRGCRRGAPAARAERGRVRAERRARAGSRAAAHTGQGGGARWRRRSAGGGAGQPRGGAARGSGRPSGLGARGRSPRTGAGSPGGVRMVTAVRPRWHGGAAAAIAPESKGETGGEQEETVGDLTRGSFCAKEGRRKVIGGEGRSSATTVMADGVWGLTSAGVGHGRVRGEMEELRGEVAQLRARGNRSGRRSSASGTSTASSARFRSLLRGRRREERDGIGSFEAFARIKAPTPRSGAIADAWRRRRRAQAPVWPASRTVPSRRCTVSSFK